jgi:hypothetical protein
VRVSGAISENQPKGISFSSLAQVNGSYIQTGCLITNGEYSVVLVGGQSYRVDVSYGTIYWNYYTIYVPSGVTTFTANF